MNMCPFIHSFIHSFTSTAPFNQLKSLATSER
jgi:hypothetical protein